MRTIIRDAMIFDGTGSPPSPGTVIVEDDRIAAICRPEDAVETSPSDIEIHARGMTLMPGLIEAHAHLSWPSSVEHIYHDFMLPPDEMKAAAWRNARILLDYGFTSAYSAGALGERLEPELKRAIDAGEVPGPRLVPSTIERAPEGDGTGIHHGRGADAMRQFVAFCDEVGVQSVKLVISGESAIKPGSSHDILYEDAELQAAKEEIAKHKLWLAVHAYTPRAVRMAIDAGARILYHCSYADEQTMDLLEAHKDQIFVAPAIGIVVATLEMTPPPHIDVEPMKKNARELLALSKVLVPELKKRGVRVLPGGDYGFPFNPNGLNARDLQHFVDLYGYTPTEALVAATKLGGQLMGMGDELGLVKEGYLADLLLVDGDPTSDVSVLQDKDRLHMVMKGGHMHKAPQSSPHTLQAS